MSDDNIDLLNDLLNDKKIKLLIHFNELDINIIDIGDIQIIPVYKKQPIMKVFKKKKQSENNIF